MTPKQKQAFKQKKEYMHTGLRADNIDHDYQNDHTHGKH